MLGVYVVITIVILCIAYAGVEETMRLFAYLDLQLRYTWVRFRMYLMRRKLEQQLIKDLPDYNKLIKELKKMTEENRDCPTLNWIGRCEKCGATGSMVSMSGVALGIHLTLVSLTLLVLFVTS